MKIENKFAVAGFDPEDSDIEDVYATIGEAEATAMKWAKEQPGRGYVVCQFVRFVKCEPGDPVSEVVE